jgi:hypothetical protein
MQDFISYALPLLCFEGGELDRGWDVHVEIVVHLVNVSAVLVHHVSELLAVSELHVVSVTNRDISLTLSTCVIETRVHRFSV